METKAKEKLAYYAASLIAAIYFVWWGANYFFGSKGSTSFEWYSDSYWLVAVVGAVCGLFVARQWGGFKSVFGRALLLFTLGLCAQIFGQLTYSYFALVKGVDAPYPSIGDIGFFSSILFYIWGVLLLSKAVGARFASAAPHQKGVAILIPLAILGASYALFLKDYEFGGGALATLLDFGYPLGQASYLSLALLAYILSLKSLGGKMKNKVLLILFALFIQYVADFLFLFRFSREQWYAGDVSDLMYQVAYLLMTIALIQIGSVARQLRTGK